MVHCTAAQVLGRSNVSRKTIMGKAFVTAMTSHLCHQCRVRHLDSSSGKVVRALMNEQEQYSRCTPEEKTIASIL